MLIDFGSTHNIIYYKLLSKPLNFFIYPTPKFEVMIKNGGTINCSRKCYTIKLTMGKYFFDRPVVTIQMGGVDVVLGV